MFEILLLLGLCIVVVVGSVIATGWLLISQQLMSFDGLLAAFVALLLAIIFFLNGFWTIRSQEFQQWWKSHRGDKNKESHKESTPVAP